MTAKKHKIIKRYKIINGIIIYEWLMADNILHVNSEHVGKYRINLN